MRTNSLPVITDRVQERFWAAVTQGDGCWLWNRCLDSKGYGVLNIGGKLYRSHRLAAQIAGMEIPQGQYVCHTCDVRACCNPTHLFVGNQSDNLRDMHAKGRNWMNTHPEKIARGDRHGSRTHPERVAKGDRNGARLHPERMPRGEQNGLSKLKTTDVVEIRARLAAGESYVVLGAHFNVSNDTIGMIARRKTWKHIL